MTVDSPCRCYICGERMNDTMDLVGVFVDQEAARKRYEEKGGKYTMLKGRLGGKDWLGVCDECHECDSYHARAAERKYNVWIFKDGKVRHLHEETVKQSATKSRLNPGAL